MVAVEISSRRIFTSFELDLAGMPLGVDMVTGDMRILLSLRGWRFVGQ
jgi:hypothetical protein